MTETEEGQKKLGRTNVRMSEAIAKEMEKQDHDMMGPRPADEHLQQEPQRHVHEHLQQELQRDLIHA